MNDGSMDSMTAILLTVLALILILWFVSLFITYRKQNKILQRSHEMDGRVEGVISRLVSVSRRNRSFRWKNEYPVVTYTVNGKEYETELSFAEKRKGSYDRNERYTVYYIPQEPEICIVDEFRGKLQSSNRNKLIGMVVLVFFIFNVVFTAISQLIS